MSETVTKAQPSAVDAATGERSDLAAVMGTEQGRRVVRRILARCKVFGSVVLGPDAEWNAQKVLYNAGMQDVGHWIMRLAEEANPAAFQRMHFEAYELVIQSKRRQDDADGR